ncbi:hypothetical protein CVT26_011525 [Gymnopilus dilepis]|uniref:Uncharacterized protein n=1 Tax=Gymnopilus dilepis TaxID=231916 RepID=A0A409W5J9_9AGAR|nr:hypothetical protein CVT26_011525 [Gymnopilus dilepis]
MLYRTLLSFALAVSLSSAFALPEPAAEGVNVELERRASGSGRATFYNVQASTTACGGNFLNTDAVAAVSAAEFGSGGLCGKSILITGQGKTVAAKVEDSCPGCGPFDLNLSPGLFEDFAPLSDGAIQVSWIIQ